MSGELLKYLKELFGSSAKVERNTKTHNDNKPKLNQGQVAVLAVDGATGIVLNIDMERYRNDSNKNIYWVFDSYTLGKNFVTQQQKENNWIEFTIYDASFELIELLNAPKWANKMNK